MNPVLATVSRGNSIESRHRGAIAVVDAEGNTVFSTGDIDNVLFPRSALKYLQAIPLVESGAAKHFSLEPQHLSFACASHNGESIHSELAASWLQLVGCTPDDLECGAELPGDEPTRHQMIELGQAPGRQHHNCSGKHCGLITVAQFLNEPVSGYRLYEHPVQQQWFSVVESMTGADPTQLPWGYDGCGIPNLAIPLRQTALGFARFANPQQLSETRVDAIEALTDAVSKHPYLVAGRKRLCTALMELTGKKVLVKTGAEGFYTAVLRELGLGVALKIDDGNSRASMAALGAVLLKLDAITANQYESLKQFVSPDVLNSRGDVVGNIQSVL